MTWNDEYGRGMLRKRLGMQPEPINFRVRRAGPDDVDDLARLHGQTFNETHAPRMWNGPSVEVRREQWREAFETRGDRWFCLVAELDDGGLIGFAAGIPYAHEEHGEFEGELNKIYVLRFYHGRGVGRRLLEEAAREFGRLGMNSMLLFGDAKSKANGFYEHMGAVRILSSAGEFHGGYGWRDLSNLARTES